MQASIRIGRDFVVPSEWEGDRHIMDIVLAHPTFTKYDHRIINYCHMYLHVTTVSELLDADGRKIQPHVWKCHCPHGSTRLWMLLYSEDQVSIRFEWNGNLFGPTFFVSTHYPAHGWTTNPYVCDENVMSNTIPHPQYITGTTVVTGHRHHWIRSCCCCCCSSLSRCCCCCCCPWHHPVPPHLNPQKTLTNCYIDI